MNNHQTRDLVEILRDEMVIREHIVTLLREGSKTIPEIAQALKHPTHEVVLWVMAMWRYGTLVDTGQPNDKGYYQYKLVETE